MTSFVICAGLGIVADNAKPAVWPAVKDDRKGSLQQKDRAQQIKLRPPGSEGVR
jgi:hypothetical protein